MADRFSGMYDLTSSLNRMSGQLDSADTWRDDVRRSYDGFISEAQNIVTSLEYSVRAVDDLASSALSVDADKLEREINSYTSRLTRI